MIEIILKHEGAESSKPGWPSLWELQLLFRRRPEVILVNESSSTGLPDSKSTTSQESKFTDRAD
jgi:hypothetical protein